MLLPLGNFLWKLTVINMQVRGGGIAQSLVSLSTKQAIQVRTRLDPLDRKVELYHCAIDSLPPVPTTGLKKDRPCVIMSV